MASPTSKRHPFEVKHLHASHSNPNIHSIYQLSSSINDNKNARQLSITCLQTRHVSFQEIEQGVPDILKDCGTPILRGKARKMNPNVDSIHSLSSHIKERRPFPENHWNQIHLKVVTLVGTILLLANIPQGFSEYVGLGYIPPTLTDKVLKLNLRPLTRPTTNFSTNSKTCSIITSSPRFIFGHSLRILKTFFSSFSYYLPLCLLEKLKSLHFSNHHNGRL